MKRATFSCALVIAALALPQPVSAQVAPVVPAPVDSVVAVVNGTEIKRSEIVIFYHSLPPQFQQIPMEAILPQLIERYVDQKLIAEAARKAGIAERAEVKRQIAVLVDGVINQTYMEERIRGQVSEGAVRDEYQKKIALEPKKEEVRARHILLKTRESAVSVIAEIRGGADFAEVAKTKSTGPSARSGGDLGFFAREQMVPAFSEAAFALKAGEMTSDPVQTQFGWHIIKVEERRVAGSRPFQEVADELRQAMSEKAYKGIIGELRAKAKVEMRGGTKITPVQ
jgi:peptidyl-prolyl cis-trans isomerase C